MSDCNCPICQHADRFDDILTKYKLTDDDKAFMRDIYEKMFMCEEDREMEHILLKPRRRARQAMYFLKLLQRARKEAKG